MKWTRRKMDEDEEGQQDVWDNRHLQRGWTKVTHDNRVRVPFLLRST